KRKTGFYRKCRLYRRASWSIRRRKRAMSRTPRINRLILPAIFGIFIASLAGPARAQSQSGRFLLTPRRDVVLECNLNASNCLNVTGASQAAGDPGGGDEDVSLAAQPSIAQNGTIAFDAVYGPAGACVPGA